MATLPVALATLSQSVPLILILLSLRSLAYSRPIRPLVGVVSGLRWSVIGIGRWWSVGSMMVEHDYASWFQITGVDERSPRSESIATEKRLSNLPAHCAKKSASANESTEINDKNAREEPDCIVNYWMQIPAS